MLPDHLFCDSCVIVGGDQNILRCIRRDPANLWIGKSRIRPLELSVLVAAMVGPVHHQDSVATRERTRSLYGVHVGFGAGVAEAHSLERRHTLTQNLSEVYLVTVGCRPPGAACQLVLENSDDFRMGVAMDQRSGIVGEIENLVAINIVEVAAFPMSEIGRMGSKSCARAGVSSGEVGLGFLK